MLIINELQIEKLKLLKVERFVAKMIGHLRDVFGFHFESVADEKIAIYVREAMGKAEVYGFSSEKSICAYVDLLVIFGWNFDVTCGWAKKTLNNYRFSDQDTRIEALFAVAHHYPQDVRNGLLSSRKVSS